MENINWEFLIQLAILITLVCVFFKLDAIVAVLHHHFDQVHEKNTAIAEDLARIESNTLSIESNTADSNIDLV